MFQIADDILDVTGTAASLGKSPGKDAAAGKLTYPAVFGLDAARRRLAELADGLGRAAAQLEGERGARRAGRLRRAPRPLNVMALLEKINSPADLRELPEEMLPELAVELRAFLLASVSLRAATWRPASARSS